MQGGAAGNTISDLLLSDALPNDYTSFEAFTANPGDLPGCWQNGQVNCFWDDFGTLGSLSSSNPPDCNVGGSLANGIAIPNGDISVVNPDG